ncbi:MAG: hypothetical protein QXP70_05950, partial [Methanomassiliicoccales archaeon]
MKRKVSRLIRALVSHIVLIIFSIFAIFPIYFILLTSFSRLNLISASSIVPNLKDLTDKAYVLVFSQPDFPIWLKNSLIFGGVSAIIGVLLAIFCGYALSRFMFPGRKPFIYFIIGISQFPGIVL